TFHTDDSELVTLSATANFSTLGPRVGKKMKDIATAIAALPENTIARIEMGESHEIDSVVIANDDIKVRRTEKPGLALKSDGFMTVALETDLTDELVAEGLVREFVHLVQNERKAANLELTERIILHVWIPEMSELLQNAITQHEDYIRRETLATKILMGEASFKGTKLKANGLEFILRVERTQA
ncbi:hypothetical protein KKB28_09525, partial [bacterium]|nr:hypothetical protein [bacterium]